MFEVVERPDPESFSISPEYSEEELNQRLVDIENEDLHRAIYDDSIIIAIVDDTTIELGGATVKLTPGKRFFLNALRVYRDYPQTGPEIRAMGYHGESGAFSLNVNELIRALNGLAGVPVIRKDDVPDTVRTKAYSFEPNVIILDRRDDLRKLSSKEWLLHSCITYKDGQPCTTPEGHILFDGPKKRESVVVAMLKEYDPDPMVQRAKTALLYDHVTIHTATQRLRMIKKYPRLENDEEIQLFEDIERGLAAYVHDDQQAEDEVRQAVVSFTKLYMHNVHLLTIFAKQFCDERARFEDLYQTAAETLTQTIARHTLKKRLAYGEFMYFAKDRIIASIKMAKLAWHSPFYREPDTPHDRRDFADLTTLNEARMEFRKEHGFYPSSQELSEVTTMRPDRILGLMALRLENLSIDAPLRYGTQGTHADLIADKTADDNLEREFELMETTAKIDHLFESTLLNDKEKIILSLYYKVYSPLLCGAELHTKNGVVFTYPYSNWDFLDVVETIDGLRDIDALFGDVHTDFSSQLHIRALRNARKAIEQMDELQEGEEDDELD